MADENSNRDDLVADQLRAIQQQRMQLAALTGEKALDFILEARHPAALIHSLPEEDFHFLIHDIGLEDALPLLALASDAQLEYILDIEGWRRDQIHLPALTKWLALMMQAQPQRLVPWLMEQQPELLEFFLHKNIQVLILEHDMDPSFFGDDFFTLDDVFYVRILPDQLSADVEEPPVDLDDDEEGETRRRTFLQRLINRLGDYDHVRYQQTLLNAAGLLPAEIEDSLYRLKTIRLAEKGFLPVEEAVGIYQPLEPKALYQQPPKIFTAIAAPASRMPVPQYPSGLLQDKFAFTDSLRLIDADDTVQQIQMEFAGLCNQLIAADQRLIRDKTVLREIVRKACGYLSLGIEALFALREKADKTHLPAAFGAALITRFPLSQVFRVGYGEVLHLKWKVRRWQKTAWYIAEGLPLSFWGEKWMGVLGGLMVKKPLFFDNYQTGDRLYREFETAEEVRTTDQTIEQVQAVDELLSQMRIAHRRDREQLLTYKSLMLTTWAGWHLRLSRPAPASKGFAPLSRKEFNRFFKTLFGIEGKALPASPRKTTAAMKASFLDWLCTSTGRSHRDLTDRLGPSLDALFNEVEEELGSVAPKDLDPRYISMFVIGR